jgi:hypothetical protein
MLDLEQWKQSEHNKNFKTSWLLLQATMCPNQDQYKKDELKAYQTYVREWLWDQKYNKTKGIK